MSADSNSSGSMHNGLTSDVLTLVLDKLGEIARAASSGSFVFRGEPKWYLEISSSLYREYKTLLEPFGNYILVYPKRFTNWTELGIISP